MYNSICDYCLILGLIILAILLAILIKTNPTTITLDKSVVNPCTNRLFWNTTGITYAGNGSSGTALNQFYSLTGLFMNSTDTLYITDNGNYRILKYLPGATSGILAAGTSTDGTALNQFATLGIRFSYVDVNQNIYVGDTYNHRVVRWSNGASSGVIVAGNGINGISLNQIARPHGVWVDSSSNVFVVDNTNHRVTKWAPSATLGVIVAGGNGQGNSSNQLSSPSGLFYDEINQDLYITNFQSNTVMKWHVGASNGLVVAGIAGSSGSSSTLLNYPTDLKLDRWNNIYVADRSNSRIQLFCNGNLTGTTIAGSGSGGHILNGPYSVALDSQLNLYVAESTAARVTKFYKL
ncbi:hypothetical protein I4U23_011096 [Adineta vaga]|nr:hypothetical protein I4U23_011096 [Adineta vaga]